MSLITGDTKFLAENFRDSGNVKDFHGSPETNLSMFRYTDTQGYETTQKCMVHRDNGFITLLPKSTLPGIQALHDNTWYPMEEFTSSGDMMVYLGVSAELFSKQNLPALRHRVVRTPNSIRYSIPFEVKANRNSKITDELTMDGLEKKMHWERIQNSVHRVDSVSGVGC